MNRRWRALPLASLVVAATVAEAQGQPVRSPRCVTAQEEVSRYRLGRDGAPIDARRAVAAGARAEAACRGDGGFLLAYSLARIDLSKETQRVGLAERKALFEAGLAGLERVRAYVAQRKSDRYEIYNVLGLVYYDVGDYQKSIDVLNSSAPFLKLMTATSRQNTFFTKGMALYQLGRNAEAAVSFGYAKRFGHAAAADRKSVV
jgi:tetratricopeptide (TPR) repeat protein